MKKLLSSLEMATFSYFIMRCAFVGITINNLILIAQQDGYLSIILGFLVGFIPILIFQYIMDYRKDCNFPEILTLTFGKTIGTILNLILCIFLFLLSTIIYWNLTNLINSQYLSLTPTLFVGIVFFFPIIYLLLKGIVVIGRTSLILFYISVILYLIPLVGLIFQIDFANVLPFLEHGIPPVLHGTHQYIANNILPLFILMTIPKDKIRDHKKFNKRIIIFYCFTSFILFSILFITLTVFGARLASLYQYPEFHILKHVSIAGFIQRIESTLSIQWIFDLFMTNLLVLYSLSSTIKHTFHIKNSKLRDIIIIFVTFLILILNNYIFPNNTMGASFLKNTFPIMLTVVFFILPVLVSIKIFIEKQKTKSSS